MKHNTRRIYLNLRGAGKIAIIAIALVIAITMLMTGCLRSPVETGAVTNTDGADVTPGETSNDEDPTEQTTTPETTIPDEGGETTEETEDASEPAAPDKEERPLESSITIELEGMPEEIITSLHMSELGYSMYYDKERYKVVETSARFDASVNVDEYMPLTPAEALPDIYMQVGYLADTPAADALTILKEQAEAKLAAEANTSESVMIGVDKLPGQRIHVVAGNEWDSEVIDVTVVDDGTGGSFFFYGGYFLEAGEGHGSRYLQMMESFRIE